MDMLKSKEGLAAEIHTLRTKLKNSRDQNSILSDQLLLLQKECKNLMNSISGYEETNHKLSIQVARLNEKNSRLKKKLKQAVTVCSDIKRQAESYISSIQARFYEQMSRINAAAINKRDTEETDASFSMNLNSGSSFRFDSPAISVSERENDSSIARHDNEDIILAYTQEIRDKQTEISSLNRILEQKSIEIENFRTNMQALRENFDKKLQDKDKQINLLKQEAVILNEEANVSKREGGRTSSKPYEPNEMDLKAKDDLQSRVQAQKKVDNYVRAISNLEKQLQVLGAKYSELEAENKKCLERIVKAENDKKEANNLTINAEARVAELEALKVQQAKVINEQSGKLAVLRHSEDGTQALLDMKKQIENLEEDNKKLVEANNYIQSYAEKVNQEKLEESERLTRKIEELTSGEIFNSLNEILQILTQYFHSSDPAAILACLKDFLPSTPLLKNLCSDLGCSTTTEALLSFKSLLTEHKIIDLHLSQLSLSGHTSSEKLESLLASLSPPTDLFSPTSFLTLPESIKEAMTQIFKDFSNKILSIITRISNSLHKVNEKLMNFTQIPRGKSLRQSLRQKMLNQIEEYEITTVNECSEKEDESFDDENVEVKLEQSVKRVRELLGEVKTLRAELDLGQERLHELELKNDRFRIDKEKKIKENNELMLKVAELETEMRKNKEVFENAEKKKNSMINTLEIRISSMKREFDQLKNSIASEKDELFDHIIRIEQESKSQSTWYKTQLEDLRNKQKQYEATLEGIEAYLGSDFTGDYIESIKNISNKKRRNSFSFNIFRRSTNKSESGSKTGTPTGSEVLSPNASTSGDNKMHKALELEKAHNVLYTQQIEALRENIRHLEYESSKNTESKIYQNLRNLVIDVLKMLPNMNQAIERKIQIITALLWLSTEEKAEIEIKRKGAVI